MVPEGRQRATGAGGRGTARSLAPGAPRPGDQAAGAGEGRDVEHAVGVPSASPARDGGQGPTVGPGEGQAEQVTPCWPPAESGAPVGGGRSHAGEALPSALPHVEGEAAAAAGADTPGGGREGSAVVARQPGGLALGGGEEVGGGARALRPPAHRADRRWWRAFTLATAWQSGEHGLAQGGPPGSPCVTGRVGAV